VHETGVSRYLETVITVGLTPDHAFKHLEGEPTRLFRCLAVVLTGKMGLEVIRRQWTPEGVKLVREPLAKRHLIHGNRWVGGGGVYSAPHIIGDEELVVHYGAEEVGKSARGPWTLEGKELDHHLTLKRVAEPDVHCAGMGFEHWVVDGNMKYWDGLDEIMLAPPGFFLGRVDQFDRGPRSRISPLAA
jgi:hypothetical protein